MSRATIEKKKTVVARLSQAAQFLAQGELVSALDAVAAAERALLSGGFEDGDQSEIADCFRALKHTASAVHADLKKQVDDNQNAQKVASRYQSALGQTYGGVR